jgi:hypothetical protein
MELEYCVGTLGYCISHEDSFYFCKSRMIACLRDLFMERLLAPNRCGPETLRWRHYVTTF